MKRATKVVVNVFIAWVGTAIIAAIAFFVYLAFQFYEPDEQLVINSPAGLGEVRFTKSGHTFRHGPTKLTIDARKSGDWFWTFVGEFQMFHNANVEFRDASWTADGAALLINTLYEGSPTSNGEASPDGNVYNRKEYPGWKRQTITHAFDFRSGVVIAPAKIGPESIDAASTQIKAIFGDRMVPSPVPVMEHWPTRGPN